MDLLPFAGIVDRSPAVSAAHLKAAQLLLTLALLVTATTTASAHHLQKDPECASPGGGSAGIVGSHPPTGMIGDAWKSWNANWELGCALSDVREHSEGDGRYADFERGQIVWSQGQNMLLAAYETPAGIAPPGITVRWEVTGRFHYDFFNVRWDKDGGGNGQEKASTQNGTAGLYHLAAGDPGRYRIVVEGCDRGGFLQKDKCRPGFSLPVYVDHWMPDFAHKIDGSPLAPAFDIASARAGVHDRVLVAARYKCANDLAGIDYSDNGNEFTVVALAKLIMADESPLSGPGPCNGKSRADLRAEVNKALQAASKKSSREVGTEVAWYLGALAAAASTAGVGAVLGAVLGLVFPVIGAVLSAGLGAVIGLLGGFAAGALLCHHDGDYDMTLRGLMPIVYSHAAALEPATRDHLLHDLLTESGGADKVRLKVSLCGISVSETENHILMTESSRYLTNQLLLEEVLDRHEGDPQSPEVALARQKYDNTQNGLEDWMVARLQLLLSNDFHEYNARSYARLATMAIRNLAEYADNGKADGRVRIAATAVLDYIAAKVAVSGNQMRRAAPFRRRDEHWTYGPLFGNNSDEFTWYFLALTGDTWLLQQARYGRGDWASADPIEFSAIGTYQVPDVILDLYFANGPGASLPYTQAIRHEGFELYAGQGDFLISGGGIWAEDNYTHLTYDGIDIALASLPGVARGAFGDDTHGFPMPTTLMPTWEGVDRYDFIRIDGSEDNDKRSNTCVTAGFACGLNPVMPASLMHRIHRMPRPCAHAVAAVFQTKYDALHGDQGPLGCPIEDAHAPAEGDGTAQGFERGQLMWSPKTPDHSDRFVQATYVNFDGDMVVEWGDTDPFHYDFFIVRWDKDGNNIGQHDVNSDDANASPRNGGWTIPNSGPGRYRVVVEGCDGSFLGSSKCRQGWSNPIFLDLPLANGCARVVDEWTFVDATNDCGGGFDSDGRGYYAVVHSNPCPSSDCSSKAGATRNYGFFEAATPTDTGFDGFIKAVLGNNGGRVWRWSGAQEYKTSDGRLIQFNNHSGPRILGVLSVNGQAPPDNRTDLDEFRLAKGDVIDADGSGCVLIKNSRMKQALLLMVKTGNIAKPQTLPLTADLSCKSVQAASH